MHMVAISEAKAKLTELVRIADDEPVLLLRHSKPVGVLLSHSRFKDLIERLEDAEDSLAALQDKLEPGESVTLDQLKAALAAIDESA